MEKPNHQGSTSGMENQTGLGDMVKSLEEKCRNCKPLTAITCVTDCKIWKLKNQLRKINERMQNPKFPELLLNTLKNERRLLLLDIISKQHSSISQLQKKMSSFGYNHSQQTIVEEYINPLLEVGLIQEAQSPYGPTVLGCRVNELLQDFRDLERILPPHSECYEERALDSLLEGPKTWEDMRGVIPANNVARVLSRLQKAELVHTREQKNYVFFFRTKRNPALSKLSVTESRVYDNIAEEGISADELSRRTAISLRRTYKYLRKLKGKKLVFARKRPLTYSLTNQGGKLAKTLRALHDLTIETQATTAQLVKAEKPDNLPPSDKNSAVRKSEGIITFTNTVFTKKASLLRHAN
jgi:predicted transcriptional regulator